MKGKRTSNLIISIVLWIIIILVQNLSIGLAANNAVSFWTQPTAYFSTWVSDIYLIMLFYLNYYVFAPQLMRRKAFGSYIVLILSCSVLALFLPILMKSLYGWGIPTNPEGAIGLAWSFFIASVSLISLGLAIKAIFEWIKLGDKCKGYEERIKQMDAELSSLKEKQSKDKAIIDSIPEDFEKSRSVYDN